MRYGLMIVYPVLGFLCACGGGGGGGSSPVRPVAFTSFSTVVPGQPVQAEGMSQTENVTQDPSGVVTATVINAPNSNASSAQFTYGPGAPLALTDLEFNAPQSTVTWKDGRAGQTITCGGPTCSLASSGATGVMINALDASVAWNYQTFGYWLVNTGMPANVMAAISVGNPTAVANIPASGTATYNGLSGGMYVDSVGALNQQTSVMTAAVNFGTQTVNFSTTGTTIRPWGTTVTPTPAPQLNMTGPALIYSAGTNLFTGPVSTATMTGTAVGRFYGPIAQEIGGTYSLSNGAIESMIGGFGGKR